MNVRSRSAIGLLSAASLLQVASGATPFTLDQTFGAGQVQFGSSVTSDLLPKQGQTLLLRPPGILAGVPAPLAVPPSAESKMIRFPDRTIAFVQGWPALSTNSVNVELFGLGEHGEYSDNLAISIPSAKLPKVVNPLIAKAEVPDAFYAIATASDTSGTHIDMKICRFKKTGGGLDSVFGCKTYAAPGASKEVLPTSVLLKKDGTLAISGFVCKDAFFPCSQYSPFLVTKAPESMGGGFGDTLYSMQGNNAAVFAMKEDRQGRLVLGGALETSASSSVALVMRTQAGSGALDMGGFSASGYFLSDFRSTTDPGPEPALAVSPRSDGTILVASLAPSVSGQDCVISLLDSSSQFWSAQVKTGASAQPNICGSMAGPDTSAVIVLNNSGYGEWNVYSQSQYVQGQGRAYTDDNLTFSCAGAGCVVDTPLDPVQFDSSAIWVDDLGILTLYKEARNQGRGYVSENYMIRAYTGDSIFHDGFGDSINFH